MNSFLSPISRNKKPSKKVSHFSVNTPNKNISVDKDFNIIKELRRICSQDKYKSFLDRITDLKSEKDNSSPQNKNSVNKIKVFPSPKKKVINDKNSLIYQNKKNNNNYKIPNFQKIQENIQQAIINMNLEIKKSNEELEHSFMQTNVNDLSIVSKSPRHALSIKGKKATEIQAFCKNVLTDSTVSNNDFSHSSIHPLKKDKNEKSAKKKI